MRASGNQIIIGTKQFSNVTVIPNLDANGNIIDAGTLTVQNETFTQGGLNISNNAHVYDSSGNLTVNSITISPVEFSNLKYCNTLTSNVQSQLNSLNSNKEGVIFNVDGSGNLTITSTTGSTTLNALICASINGISSTSLAYFDISSSLTGLLNNKQNTISNISYFDISSSLTGLLNNKQNTVSNISYFDISSSLTGLLNNKQNTVSNISYFDISSSLTGLLNNKQNTVSNISYFDISSSLTGLLNTINSNIGTNTTNIASNTSSIATNTTNIASNTSSIATNTTNIASNTSSISTINTSLTGKQSLITTSSNLSFNNIVISGTITFPSNSLSTSYISGYSAPSSLLSSSNTWTSTQTFSSISTSGETDSGTLSVSGQTNLSSVGESFISSSGSSSPFTINFANGSVFYLPTDYTTGLSSNFNIKIQNIPLQTTASRTYTMSIIYKNANKVYCNGVIVQDSSSAYLCSSGSSTYITPLWGGASTPSLTSSNIICQTFTILYMLNSSGTLTYTQCISSVNAFA
jgi:hypothetical protein